MQLSAIVRTSFLDGFAMAGLFNHLRRPGAPTEVFADLQEEAGDGAGALQAGSPEHQHRPVFTPIATGTIAMGRPEGFGEVGPVYVPIWAAEARQFQSLRGEMQQRLMDAIDELPEGERLVMTLYYYDEMTMEKIALAIGILESDVAQIHSRSIARLRELLVGVEPEVDRAPLGAWKQFASSRIYRDLLGTVK